VSKHEFITGDCLDVLREMPDIRESQTALQKERLECVKQ